MLREMVRAPESALKLREISFLVGAPSIAIQCADIFLPAAGAFRDNIRRNQALAELPARLAGWAALTEHMDNLARFKAGIPMTSDVHDEESSNFDPVRASDFRKQYQMVWSAVREDARLSSTYIKQNGLRHIDILLASRAEHLESGLESVFAAVTLGTWTAFEALLSDIWEAAVNFGPKEWHRSVFKNPDIKLSKAQEKSLSISALQELDYDVREKMGTLLKRQKKVDFQSLKNITIAYKGAFGVEAERIFSDHKELATLEAVRNLYAHRGGQVDEQFVRRVASHPIFGAVPIGSFLRLDGVMVKEFIESAVNCGVELLHLIDAKLAEHRKAVLPAKSTNILDDIRLMKKEGATWKRTSRWKLLWRAVRQLFR